MKIRKTVSDKTVTSNRENAKKSTGPKSDVAKKNLKFHAVKHGLLTKALLLRNEKEEREFQELAENLESYFKPRSIMEEMLVEDIAVSWWKLKTVQRLLIKDLRSRQKTSEAVLDTLNNASSGVGIPLSSSSRELRMATDFGWECRELVLRVEGKQFDEKEKDVFNAQPEKTGHIAMEAKLGNSSESLLRYERAWKADLYRAIAALKNLHRPEARPFQAKYGTKPLTA
jgi:hypothetical protein